MARKIKPVERTQFFTLPASTVSYIDSGFSLAWMNRQSMKQGMEYVIESIELFGDPGVAASIQVETLSKNWVSSNSWVKGFTHWKAQQDEWLEEAGQQSRKGRYNDFKIFYDAQHSNVDNLLPQNTLTEVAAQAIDATAQSEWDYSQVVVPNEGGTPGNTVEYFLMMVGPDAGTRKGLITNYALSRQRPQVFDPNQVGPSTDGGLYQDMVDVGEILEDVGTNVSTNNFVAPYLLGNNSDYEWYPGGANNAVAGSTIRDILSVRSGAGAFSSDSSGMFSALCGLIKIENNEEVDLTIRVTWAAGDYKGVMARPMQDVN